MKKGKALEQFLSAENYNYRVVVHCRTKLEARSFLKFLHKLGYSWCSSDSLFMNKRNFYENNAYNRGVVFGDIDYAKSAKYQITNLYSMLNRTIPSD